ncbi:MAG TPA: hypothetical protein VH186_14895 [Chloroflexia bacterium]|nr:hypothetical protein [Chloroflexia bacterium]
MDTNQGQLLAHLKQVGPQFVFFELTIYDPTVSGELIMPYPEFVNFLREQGVSIVADTEEERILLMQLNDALAARNLKLS